MKTYVELVSSKDRLPSHGKAVPVLGDKMLWFLWELRSWSTFPKNHQWIDHESRIDVPTDDTGLLAWHREQISAIEKRLEEKRQAEDEQARREKAKAFIAATGMTRDDVSHWEGSIAEDVRLYIDISQPFAAFRKSEYPDRIYYANDFLCKRWTGVLLSDLDEPKRKDGE